MNINIVNLTSLRPNNKLPDQLNEKLRDSNIFLKENASESPLTLFFIQSGGTEALFLSTMKNYKEPYYIIPYNESSALAATMEIATYLNKYGYRHEILLPDKNLSYNVSTLASAYNVKNKINGTRLGVIGSPSSWLVGSNVDEKKVREIFGITLVGISLDELYRYLDKPVDIKYPANYQDLTKKNPFDDRLLFESTLVYNGLKKIVEKYHLDGFTIRCFDLVEKYKISSCLGLALLNDEGIVAGCEGDIPALLTMFISYKALHKPSFMCNLSSLNDEDDTYTFAHCTIPFKMVKNYKLMSHYETNESIGIRGEMYTGDVTLIKISPDLKDMKVYGGKIVENLTNPCACRTQIKVDLDCERQEFIDSKYANHNIVVYGNYVNFFKKLYKILLVK